MLPAMPSANYACGSNVYMSKLCSCQTIYIAPWVANCMRRVQEVEMEIERVEWN